MVRRRRHDAVKSKTKTAAAAAAAAAGAAGDDVAARRWIFRAAARAVAVAFDWLRRLVSAVCSGSPRCSAAV